MKHELIAAAVTLPVIVSLAGVLGLIGEQVLGAGMTWPFYMIVSSFTVLAAAPFTFQDKKLYLHLQCRERECIVKV